MVYTKQHIYYNLIFHNQIKLAPIHTHFPFQSSFLYDIPQLKYFSSLLWTIESGFLDLKFSELHHVWNFQSQ